MPAVAKGELVQIGISGGDLRREIRIPANNADLGYDYTSAPTEKPTVTPYLVMFYVALGTEIVTPPPLAYFPGARLLHDPASGPERNWYLVDPSLARVIDRAIAAARAGRFRSARPVGVTITSWPLLASWAVPLVCLIAAAAWRSRLRDARPPAREALA